LEVDLQVGELARSELHRYSSLLVAVHRYGYASQVIDSPAFGRKIDMATHLKS